MTDHDIDRLCNSVTSAVKLRREQGVTSETNSNWLKILPAVSIMFNDHKNCAKKYCKSNDGDAPDLSTLLWLQR